MRFVCPYVCVCVCAQCISSQGFRPIGFKFSGIARGHPIVVWTDFQPDRKRFRVTTVKKVSVPLYKVPEGGVLERKVIKQKLFADPKNENWGGVAPATPPATATPTIQSARRRGLRGKVIKWKLFVDPKNHATPTATPLYDITVRRAGLLLVSLIYKFDRKVCNWRLKWLLPRVIYVTRAGGRKSRLKGPFHTTFCTHLMSKNSQ